MDELNLKASTTILDGGKLLGILTPLPIVYILFLLVMCKVHYISNENLLLIKKILYWTLVHLFL